MANRNRTDCKVLASGFCREFSRKVLLLQLMDTLRLSGTQPYRRFEFLSLPTQSPKGRFCPTSVFTMKCCWPMHDGASWRHIFEKRTGLSFRAHFAVPDCIPGIIAIRDCRRPKKAGSQACCCFDKDSSGKAATSRKTPNTFPFATHRHRKNMCNRRLS